MDAFYIFTQPNPAVTQDRYYINATEEITQLVQLSTTYLSQCNLFHFISLVFFISIVNINEP